MTTFLFLVTLAALLLTILKANRTADLTTLIQTRAVVAIRSSHSATTFYANTLVGIDAAGYMAKWADTAGHKFLGLLQAGCVGNTSATPPVEGRVDVSGITLKSQLVASVAQSDVNGLVYCTTDNVADFTLSAGSNVKAVGWVSRYVSSGVADVTLFTPEEHQGLN